MRIPSPYFESVPCYGNLDMEQIIVDYVYPLLSVLKDQAGHRYLCMCFDTRESQKWIVAPLSVPDLIELLTDQIPLDAPFKNCKNPVVLATRNYETKNDSFLLVAASEIPSENLPAPGEYLEADEGEWRAYISRLESESDGWVSMGAGYHCEFITATFSTLVHCANLLLFKEDKSVRRISLGACPVQLSPCMEWTT